MEQAPGLSLVLFKIRNRCQEMVARLSVNYKVTIEQCIIGETLFITSSPIIDAFITMMKMFCVCEAKKAICQ